ncbi:MAG TPA: prepilin-type N-terminal cleavage/methylation domain-containing protein, partial [Zoogloea sp.]
MSLPLIFPLHTRRAARRLASAGFTLLELLVVMTIIGLL